MKILIAEDDELTREGLQEVFEIENYEVVTASNGSEALDKFKQEQPDLVCLDIMMPEKNGYDVCKEIRKIDEIVPVLFISAKSEEIDKVLGLELGADDFIMKPFGIQEVLARVRSIMRRVNKNTVTDEKDTFLFGSWTIKPQQFAAFADKKEIPLNEREMKMLTLLFRNKGKVVNRDQFFDFCWGMNFVPNSRTLDQQIANLRKKIEDDPKNPVLIRTVHGIGYRH